MDLYFFHHDEYERLYNCSLYNIDQIPIEKRQHKILGFFFFILSTIYGVSKYIQIIILGRNPSSIKLEH